MTRTPDELRSAADSKFKKKQQQLVEGEKAWADYQAAARATDEKTARLRKLRLAQEAKAQQAAEAKPKAKAKAVA